MIMRRLGLTALALLCASAVLADPPPATAPPYRSSSGALIPVAIYDAQGNIVGSFGGNSTGSVTPAGTNGSQAQAIQGINGGVPVAIQGGNATAVKTDGSGTTQPVSAAALPLPAGAATAANQATELASLATIAQRAVTFADATNQNISANTQFTSTIRDLGAAPVYTRHNVAIFSSQAGIAQLVACSDSGCGANFTISQQSVTAGSFATLSAPLYARYVRFNFLMSGTAGVINATSSLTAN